MRPSRFSEVEMVAALRQVRDGATAVQVCRKLGITETTFYRWRAKHGHAMGGSGGGSSNERDLLAENRKLKQIVADLVLENRQAADNRLKKR